MAKWEWPKLPLNGSGMAQPTLFGWTRDEKSHPQPMGYWFGHTKMAKRWVNMYFLLGEFLGVYVFKVTRGALA